MDDTSRKTNEQIARLAGLIETSRVMVVFCGAGMSTESGIPDFRSPGGIWTQYNPEEFTYQKFISSAETRRKSWERFRLSGIFNAKPNPAHYALADLERMGKLHCIITQNIDGLHQKAGSSDERVIEIHGTDHWVVCLDCEARYPSADILRRLDAGEEIPACERCGGMLKTATISFGQAMPQKEMADAERWAAMADLFIVVGSSLVVFPAAQLPLIAAQNGARLVIINLEKTPMDSYATEVVREKAGEFLPQVVAALRHRLAN